jgi:hypothetical protein
MNCKILIARKDENAELLNKSEKWTDEEFVEGVIDLSKLKFAYGSKAYENCSLVCDINDREILVDVPIEKLREHWEKERSEFKIYNS